MQWKQVRDRYAASGLRNRMVALVMVPVLGMTGYTAVNVATGLHSSQQAQKGLRLVDDAVAIDHVRTGFAQEVVPNQGVAALGNAETMAALGVPKGVNLPLDALRHNVRSFARKTDEAVAAALARPGLRTEMETMRARLVATRAELAPKAKGGKTLKDLSRANDMATQLSLDLARLETSKVVAATKLGLDGSTSDALRELDLVMRAVQNANLEGSQYMAIQTAATQAMLSGYQQHLAAQHANYLSAIDAIATTAGPGLKARLDQAQKNPDVAAFDRKLKAAITAPFKKRNLAAMNDASTGLTLDAGRNKEYSQLLKYMTDVAAARAGAMKRHSYHLFLLNIAVNVLVELLVLALVIRITRSVTRPLSTMAGQVVELSQGQLHPFAVEGPKEVRTVAGGLNSTVTTFQRIQQSAEAVVHGEFDAPVLNEPLPGRLGEAIHDSLTRIADAIAAQERAQAELEHRAGHDALTELPNRAQAMVAIESALHRANRLGHSTGLMFVDLDRFKQVNDTLGHEAGDKVLQLASDRMREVVRAGDMVARLGGDEFLILLENITDETDLQAMGERLVASLSEPMRLGDQQAIIGASVGVSVSRDGTIDPGALMREADAAVYEAKRGGRGRVNFFDENLRQIMSSRAEIEDAIVHGLANDEFELHYQPVVDLKTERIKSLEALIRWHRPGYGMVPPDEFIPTAEMTNLINDVDRWTMRMAARQLATWNRTPGLEELAVGVNVSGRHMCSADILDEIVQVLDETGIAPAQLILEITETVVLDDPRALTNMSHLRELGVQIALDDFGTGFTSIGQLARLPIDILKIDRSFTSSPDETHRTLVELMVTAAHAFGLEVVAEGVETERQVEQLRRVLADTGQGYFFARPAPAVAAALPVPTDSIPRPAKPQDSPASEPSSS